MGSHGEVPRFVSTTGNIKQEPLPLGTVRAGGLEGYEPGILTDTLSPSSSATIQGGISFPLFFTLIVHIILYISDAMPHPIRAIDDAEIRNTKF